jgi:endonuclease/exonuclease/phosphatase family metal-dependent hydrolase
VISPCRQRSFRRACGLPPAFAILLLGAAAVRAAPPIVLDGDQRDWTGRPVAVSDPADAPGAPMDLGAVQVASDGAYVHWRIEVGTEQNLQRLPRSLEIALDADGDPRTGRREAGIEGVDLTVVMSPRDPQRPDEPGQGVTVRWAGAGPPAPEEGRVNPAYALDWMSAPTHSSDWFEMRLRRGPAWPGGPSIFAGRSFSFLVRIVEADGRVIDTTEAVDVALAGPIAAAVPDAAGDRDPLARADGTTLRVVSWNTEYGGFFDNPRAFANVVRALRPDVLLLQEIPEKHPAAELLAVLEDVAPAPEGTSWRLVYGEGGGPLRCAVASLQQLTPLAPVRLIPYPQRPDRSVRVAGAIVHHRDRHVAVASIHLTCCGGLGEERDQRRQTEASLINAALRRAADYAPIDAVVVAGDFNLVGSPRPLALMAEGLDPDGSGLVPAEAVQLDGRSSTTWADPRQPFAPGRLDFVLYSRSSLELRRSFTFDSRDVPERWRDHHELNVDDTQAAADHLPLVVDLAVRSGPSRP